MNPLRWAAFLTVFLAQCVSLQLTQDLAYPVARPLGLPTLRRFIRWTQRQWGVSIVFFTSVFSPTKLVVSGVDDALDGNVILIANHQTFADWWYLWCFAFTKNRHDSFKIILKHSLKHIPIFGWKRKERDHICWILRIAGDCVQGMQLFEFIFLRRNWAEDSKSVGKTLAAYSEPSHHPLCLVIFPEGTILRESSRQLSLAYAKKNGHFAPKHMLLPRTTGLHFCVNRLRQTVPTLVDVTIGYKGVKAGQIPSLVYKLKSIFLDGRGPPEVHMHFRKYSMKDIPTDENEFIAWTMKVYGEKDALLDRFYSEGSFAPVRKTAPVTLGSTMPPVAHWVVLGVQTVAWYSLGKLLFTSVASNLL